VRRGRARSTSPRGLIYRLKENANGDVGGRRVRTRLARPVVPAVECAAVMAGRRLIASIVWILLSSLIHPVRAEPLRLPALAAEHRAGLVVDLGAGSAVQRCVAFSEDTVTGLDLLARSGLKLQTWGSAVCRVEGQGCDYPVEPCFCRCRGTPCAYWSYWHWEQGRWTYSSVGAAAYALQDGDIDGWAWGDGDPPAAQPDLAACLAEESSASGAATETPIPVLPRAPSGADGAALPVSQYVAFVGAAFLLAGALVLRNRRMRR
jgi:hypothetical protein